MLHAVGFYDILEKIRLHRHLNYQRFPVVWWECLIGGAQGIFRVVKLFCMTL